MTQTAAFLYDLLDRARVDALLFNHSENVPSVNVRFLSGFTGSDGAVLIAENELHLFTDGRYKTQAAEQAPAFTRHIVRGKIAAIARALKRKNVKRLGIEGPRLSWAFVTALTKKAGSTEIVPLDTSFLEELRLRKTSAECDLTARAAEIASTSCRELLQGSLEGRVETEVAADLEMRFRRHGAEGIAFETIVASGKRSALPHGIASNKTIRRGELIVIDFGCRYNGYHSDETVTCVIGRPTDEQAAMCRAVREAHDKALDSLRIGIPLKDVDKIARDSITEAGYGKYFVHGLGHGVGLEIHEPPTVSKTGKLKVEEGMIFTIEPGVYIAGVGGVRLESLVFMEETGPRILSRMPKDLIEIN
jgi:Xaa-Pro aminopeptidase